MQSTDGRGEKPLPRTMKTFEIGVVLLVHAKDVEEAQRLRRRMALAAGER